MPRTPSGGYDLPAGQPAVSKTLITAEIHNDFANDVADTLEDSLSRSGKGGMLVPFRVADGTSDSPAYSFTNSLSSGMFFESTSRFVGISVDRSQVVTFYPTRIVVDGELSSVMLKGTEQADIDMITNTVAVMTGSPVNTNIKIDTHQIQASDNGQASTLDLNPHGGDVLVNGRPVNVSADEYFLKTEHLISSAGAVDAYKPIILNSAGKIHESMIEIAAFVFVDSFTPTSFDEYPDETGHSPGNFWVIEGLTADYTFQSGDLAGQVAKNGNFMILGSSSWALSGDDIDPNLYYRLDGGNSLTAPFAAGGYQLKSLAPGSDDTDAVTVGQVKNLGYFYKLDGTTPLEADMPCGGFMIRNMADGVDDGDAANVGQINGLVPLNGSRNMTGDLYVGDGLTAAKSIFVTSPNAEESSFVLNREDGTRAGSLLTDTPNDRIVIEKSDAAGVVQFLVELTADKKLRIDGNEAIHFGNVISVSAGGADAGKPIVLNSSGQVDQSMIDLAPTYLVGDFTPTAGSEYPDTTGESNGAYWQVTGLTGTYTFTGGDLAGQEVDNSDLMMWGTASWVISKSDLNPDEFYRLDGTSPILAPFAGGGHQLKQVANGTESGDAITFDQNELKLDKTGTAADSTLFNGQAVDTFIRNSGDQNISGGNLTVTNAASGELNLIATDGVADEKHFSLSGDSDGTFNLKLKSDDLVSSVTPLSIARTGMVVDNIFVNTNDFVVNSVITQKATKHSIQSDAEAIVSFEQADGTVRGAVGVNAAVGDNATVLTAFNNDGSGSVAGSMTISGATGEALFSNDINVTQNANITGALGVTGAIVSQGDITAFSDKRVKTDLQVITDAIYKVCYLTGYTFERTDVKTERQTGLIAQEVKEVLPEAVRTNEDGMMSVAYGNIAGLFVEAIKDLKAEIELLKFEIEDIKRS